MPHSRKRLAWTFLALLVAFPASRAILAVETEGVVYNYCSGGPIVLAFSSLPDSCTVDLGAARCPQADTGDLTLAGGMLKAPGGIMDYGQLEDFDLLHEIAVPSAGYEDSVAFRPRRLYALKVGERGFALFSEVRNFIGGCMHQEFRWRYNSTSNHFSRGPVAVSLVRKAGEGGPATGGPRTGLIGGTERQVFDARGRSAIVPDASGRHPVWNGIWYRPD